MILCKKKVPHGTNDNRKALITCPNVKGILRHAIASIIQNATNRTPCKLPMIRTQTGISKIYFNGIAIRSSSKKETPSRWPIRNNNFLAFSNNLFFRCQSYVFSSNP